MEKLKSDIESFVIRHKRPIKIWALVIVCGLMLLKGVMQLPQISENRQQIAKLEKQIEYEKARQAEIDELSTKVDSDEYKEKIASEKLGLVKVNAKIFVDISEEQQ